MKNDLLPIVVSFIIIGLYLLFLTSVYDVRSECFLSKSPVLCEKLSRLEERENGKENRKTKAN